MIPIRFVFVRSRLIIGAVARPAGSLNPFRSDPEAYAPGFMLTRAPRAFSYGAPFIVLLALLPLLLCFSSASAQVMTGGNFQITSSVQAGGGGASTGSGNRVIEGTTGQTAAGGPSSSSGFTHDAGFWQTTSASVATASPTPTGTPPPNTIQFSAANYAVLEAMTATTVSVTRTGDTSGTAAVDYTTIDGSATQRADFEYAAGHLSFAPGETAKNIQILINADDYAEGNQSFSVTLSNPAGATLGAQGKTIVTILDNVQFTSNPIDDPQSYVWMQYHDFLNREPDASGLAFWTNQIAACGSDSACIDAARVNVSAAFFFSIEFQQTGYLVYRLYKAAYGNLPHAPVPVVINDFLPDTQEISRSLVVNQPGWQQVLENNMQAFTSSFVQRSRFTLTYAASLTPAQFVDALFANAGVTPSIAERQAAIDEFAGAATSGDSAARGRALRRVADNGTLVQQEFNRAFVLMQYFVYLRRNPSDAQDTDYAGYDFWVQKLNQFNGNYISAEMVRAFITSGEYRQRFGP